MVNPEHNRIDPSRRLDQTTNNRGQVRRKTPTRDFEKVVEQVEQVDEKRYQEDEPDHKKTGKKRVEKTGVFDPKDTAGNQMGMPATSVFDLARGPTTNTPSENTVDSVGHNQRGKSVAFDASNKRMEHMLGAIEQPDLASFVPSPAPPPLTTESTAFTSVMASPQNPNVNVAHTIQEIIDQIVSRVSYLEQAGTHETVIDLKGAFQGSRLIITEFDSAKGEMNITIDKLTAAMQKIIETNKPTLLNDLAHKNIVVHIFTASTTQEPTRTDALARSDERGQGDEQQDENRGKKKK
jgi:hypothetical protein